MSDPLDQADQAANMFLESALRAKAKIPENTGFCLSCGEPTSGAFCSKECREDYERAERIKKIRGQ